MKFRYRVLPEGAADGAIPLNCVFIDQADAKACGLTNEDAVKLIAKAFKDSCAAVNVMDKNGVSVSSDGIMNPIAVVATACVDHGMINPAFGYMDISPIPMYETMMKDEPHMRQWLTDKFAGKPLHRGPNSKDIGERTGHNEYMTMTGRIANNNSGSEFFNMVEMTEVLALMAGQYEIMNDGEVMIGVAGPEVSVGIGMIVSERWGRIFGGNNLGRYLPGMTAHASAQYAKTVKSDYPVIAATKPKFMETMLDALDIGLVPGRELGCSPALLCAAKAYGKEIDFDRITPASWIELESVGITKEMLMAPVEKPYTREEMIIHADEIIPGVNNPKYYKVSEICEIREIEI
jgi:hypothetical protein